MRAMGSTAKPRLLIFIVACFAERTIDTVIKRIPKSLLDIYDAEILVIDDGSAAATFLIARDDEGRNVEAATHQRRHDRDDVNGQHGNCKQQGRSRSFHARALHELGSNRKR